MGQPFDKVPVEVLAGPHPLDSAQGLRQMLRHGAQEAPPVPHGLHGHNVKGQEPGDEPLWQGVLGELAQEARVARAGRGKVRLGGGIVEHAIGVAEEERGRTVLCLEEREEVGVLAHPGRVLGRPHGLGILF